MQKHGAATAEPMFHGHHEPATRSQHMGFSGDVILLFADHNQLYDLILLRHSFSLNNFITNCSTSVVSLKCFSFNFGECL